MKAPTRPIARAVHDLRSISTFPSARRRVRYAILRGFLAALAISSASSIAQTPKPAEPSPSPATSEEAKAANSIADAYEAAYNKGDAKAVADFFADDAEYVDSDGTVIEGRDAIETLLKRVFAASPGLKLEIDVENVRPLGPDLFAERGSTHVTSPDGSDESSRYVAVHAKKNGKWVIKQLAELPSPQAASTTALNDLDWLVGEWDDEEADTKVKTTVRWSENNTFLVRDFEVTKGDETVAKGHEIIGWDPVNHRVRSWTFDTRGGFGEGLWIRQGNRWFVHTVNTLPGGSVATAQNILTKTDDDHATWESVTRTVDGDLTPNVGPIRVARVK